MQGLKLIHISKTGPDRVLKIPLHEQVITSHRTLWYEMLLEMISTLKWEGIFQYLIVPHSNNNESHRKTFMSNRESDGQNDVDEVIYFHLQAYVICLTLVTSLVTSQRNVTSNSAFYIRVWIQLPNIKVCTTVISPIFELERRSTAQNVEIVTGYLDVTPNFLYNYILESSHVKMVAIWKISKLLI